MEQYRQCRKCVNKSIPPNKPPLPKGYYYKRLERDFNFVNTSSAYWLAEECECHKKWSKNKELLKKFEKSGFQSNLFDYKITSYLGNKSDKNIVRLTRYWDRIKEPEIKASFLYFYGKPGTQKTTVATYVGKKILEAGLSCKYIQMNDLVLKLHKANTDQGIKEEIEYLENSHIIIIDEAFTNRSQWGGYFENFIKTRIIKGKGIIFISNTPINMISQYYGDNIQDLIEREILKRNSLFIFEDHWASLIGEIPEDLF